MYDSPLAYCAVCKAWVALDQTQRECAERQPCRLGPGECPLASFFATPGTKFDPEPATRERVPFSEGDA